jgi:hypothetical protein
VTLFLGFSIDSCGDPHRGYDLARGWAYESIASSKEDEREYKEDKNLEQAGWRKRKVYWLGFSLFTLMNQFGRAVYISGLFLAGLAPMLLFVARYHSRLLQKMRLRAWVFGFALTLSLLVLSDYIFTVWVYFSELELHSKFTISSPDESATGGAPGPIWYFSWSLCWLVPAAIWVRFAVARVDGTRARWPAVRSFLSVLYAPWYLFAFILSIVAAVHGLYGLPCYFTGLHLLAFGYRRLVDRP